MSDDFFLTILRATLGLTGLWMGWMVVKAFMGARNPGSPEGDATDKDKETGDGGDRR